MSAIYEMVRHVKRYHFRALLFFACQRSSLHRMNATKDAGGQAIPVRERIQELEKLTAHDQFLLSEAEQTLSKLYVTPTLDRRELAESRRTVYELRMLVNSKLAEIASLKKRLNQIEEME